MKSLRPSGKVCEEPAVASDAPNLVESIDVGRILAGLGFVVTPDKHRNTNDLRPISEKDYLFRV